MEACDVRVEMRRVLEHPTQVGFIRFKDLPMFRYSFSQNKIGVQIAKLRAFEYWFSVAVSAFILSGTASIITGSLLMWAAGLTVSVCAWLLDVSHRRLTFDNWRPHIVFWPTMAIVTLLSAGIAGVVTIPGYLIEKRIS